MDDPKTMDSPDVSSKQALDAFVDDKADSVEDEDVEDLGYEEEEDEELIEYRIPRWANEQNRALMQELKRKRGTIDREEDMLVKLTERKDAMDEHVKNVTKELEHTQAMLESKAKEIEAEDHLKRLAEEYLQRVKQDVAKKNESCVSIENTYGRSRRRRNKKSRRLFDRGKGIG